MSNMRRWDPFNEMTTLRDAMNQLFEDSVVSSARTGKSTGGMPLNVSETQDAYTIEAVLPGVAPEDIDVTIQDNVLTIKGETRNNQEQKNANYHLVERRYGAFSRSISLPTAVNSEAVQASLENGILHLNVPKAEAVKPRRITVNGSRTLESHPVDVQTDDQATQSLERGQ